MNEKALRAGAHCVGVEFYVAGATRRSLRKRSGCVVLREDKECVKN